MSKSLSAFHDDPYGFCETNDIKILVKLARAADNAYYNTDEPILEDQEYDLLLELIKGRDPKNAYLNESGASVEKVDKVKIVLPYCLGSAFKPNAAEIEKFIIKFKKKYPGPYIVSEKLDGVSALLRINEKKGHQMMTKGNSKVGTDISNLIEGIIETETDIPMDIRGEIIMQDSTFQNNHASIKKNARNAVAGLVNSKTVDQRIVRDSDYVAYEIIKPWLPYDEQMVILEKVNGFVVMYEMVDDFDVKSLTQLYRKYIAQSAYECDGIIISHNNPAKRENVKYPGYMFAFKNMDDLETAIVTVREVIWQTSKDGYIKPVITFNPVELAGVDIKRVTSHNAKYIYDNNLGPGAQIELVRSGGVIPYIKRIVKSALEPQMPKVDYTWNFTEVDIITTEYSEEQKIKELTKFFTGIGIENLASKNTQKLIDANIDTIPKVVRVTKRQLSNVVGFKTKMVDKIFNNIHEKVDQMSLPMFMVASNIFGHGFGKRLMNKVFKHYPDIFFKYIELNESEFYDCLMEIDGFAEERSRQFQISMEILLNTIDQLPQNIQDLLVFTSCVVEEDGSEDERFLGKKFVFSGERNKDWERTILLKGGEISTSVSKNTYAVVTTQDVIDQTSNKKIKEAIAVGCRILNHEDFYNEFIAE